MNLKVTDVCLVENKDCSLLEFKEDEDGCLTLSFVIPGDTRVCVSLEEAGDDDSDEEEGDD